MRSKSAHFGGQIGGFPLFQRGKYQKRNGKARIKERINNGLQDSAWLIIERDELLVKKC